MDLEEITMKNPEDLSKEMNAAVIGELFGDQQPQEEQKQSGDAQPTSQDTEDIPNASIRLDKMRDQRDKERHERAELEKRFAQMEGKLSVLDKGDNVDESDPTEYMDDAQKFLYNENKGLKDTISKLTDVVQGIQTESSKRKLSEQEDRFFENNPKLKEKRQEFIDDILGYLENKPSIKKMLKTGEINLAEVNGMFAASKPKSVKSSKVSDPDKIFSGHSDSVPVSKTEEGESAVLRRKAMSILHDRNSVNKREAADFLHKEITKDIVSQLDI